MDVRIVNPFINSVTHTFSTMLESSAARGEIKIGEGRCGPSVIVGTIGIAGKTRGTVALVFPTNTAIRLVNRLLGSELKVVDDSVSDGVGELVNIVAGSAKADLSSELDEPLSLSLPTVVRGSEFELSQPSNCRWLDVSFNSEFGPFVLKVVLSSDNGKN